MFIKSKQTPTAHWFFQKKNHTTKQQQRGIKLDQKEGGSEHIKGSSASQDLRLNEEFLSIRCKKYWKFIGFK